MAGLLNVPQRAQKENYWHDKNAALPKFSQATCQTKWTDWAPNGFQKPQFPGHCKAIRAKSTAHQIKITSETLAQTRYWGHYNLKTTCKHPLQILQELQWHFILPFHQTWRETEREVVKLFRPHKFSKSTHWHTGSKCWAAWYLHNKLIR